MNEQESFRAAVEAYREQMQQYIRQRPAEPSATDEPAVPVAPSPPSQDTVPREPLDAVPTAAAPPMRMSTGYLQVFATTAGQSLPVPNVHVTVSRRENGGDVLVATTVTGRNGLSPVLSLPAVDSRYSQTPTAEKPYTLYRLLLTAEGFYSQRIENLTLFGGITALQQSLLIPLPDGTSSGLTVVDGMPPEL